MKEHEIRIAIAESCGWTECRYVEGLRDVRGVPPTSYKPDLIQDSNEAWVPQYTRDLNAMHATENCLNPEERAAYVDRLGEMFGDSWEFCTASAAQRAEAYLRAKELWKEEE